MLFPFSRQEMHPIIDRNPTFNKVPLGTQILGELSKPSTRTIKIQIPDATHAIHVETRSFEGVSTVSWNATPDSRKTWTTTACWKSLLPLYDIADWDIRSAEMTPDDARNIICNYPQLDDDWTDDKKIKQLLLDAKVLHYQNWPRFSECCQTGSNLPILQDLEKTRLTMTGQAVSRTTTHSHTDQCPRHLLLKQITALHDELNPATPYGPELFPAPFNTPLKQEVWDLWNDAHPEFFKIRPHKLRRAKRPTSLKLNQPTFRDLLTKDDNTTAINVPTANTTNETDTTTTRIPLMFPALDEAAQQLLETIKGVLPGDLPQHAFALSKGTDAWTLHPVVFRPPAADDNNNAPTPPTSGSPTKTTKSSNHSDGDSDETDTADEGPWEKWESHRDEQRKRIHMIPSNTTDMSPHGILIDGPFPGNRLQYHTAFSTITYYCPTSSITKPTTPPSDELLNELSRPFEPLEPSSPVTFPIKAPTTGAPFKAPTEFPFPAQQPSGFLYPMMAYFTGSHYINPAWFGEGKEVYHGPVVPTKENPTNIPRPRHNRENHVKQMDIVFAPDSDDDTTDDTVIEVRTSTPTPSDKKATLTWTCTADNPAECDQTCSPASDDTLPGFNLPKEQPLTVNTPTPWKVPDPAMPLDKALDHGNTNNSTPEDALPAFESRADGKVQAPETIPELEHSAEHCKAEKHCYFCGRDGHTFQACPMDVPRTQLKRHIMEVTIEDTEEKNKKLKTEDTEEEEDEQQDPTRMITPEAFMRPLKKDQVFEPGSWSWSAADERFSASKKALTVWRWDDEKQTCVIPVVRVDVNGSLPQIYLDVPVRQEIASRLLHDRETRRFLRFAAPELLKQPNEETSARFTQAQWGCRAIPEPLTCAAGDRDDEARELDRKARRGTDWVLPRYQFQTDPWLIKADRILPIPAERGSTPLKPVAVAIILTAPWNPEEVPWTIPDRVHHHMSQLMRHTALADLHWEDSLMRQLEDAAPWSHPETLLFLEDVLLRDESDGPWWLEESWRQEKSDMRTSRPRITDETILQVLHNVKLSLVEVRVVTAMQLMLDSLPHGRCREAAQEVTGMYLKKILSDESKRAGLPVVPTNICENESPEIQKVLDKLAHTPISLPQLEKLVSELEQIQLGEAVTDRDTEVPVPTGTRNRSSSC